MSRRHQRLSLPAPRRAFSLIELVIVVLIIGTIATIAVPRVMHAAQRSKQAAKAGSVAAMQRAIDLYTAEHAERCPAVNASGIVSLSSAEFEQRLVGKTTMNGHIDASGAYGPYLREIPVNPGNQRATIRINGAPAGSHTHGWRYDTASRRIEPDDVEIGQAGEVDAGDGKPLGTGLEEDPKID
ncbi:MAG: prepilin-type N-terminal cleavage/methylation domain-containing protein [Phycisphaeraceae bacterium]|nr:prepilin-type N-terminal cleavage/methylation domain-containing protein [Phycisphaerae bacterium]MBX3393233.1 prepilin-type N-terminal cleavage/methylation domain-containing protein [Phycisphaeraceae bacterium]